MGAMGAPGRGFIEKMKQTFQRQKTLFREVASQGPAARSDGARGAGAAIYSSFKVQTEPSAKNPAQLCVPTSECRVTSSCAW
jgi:hypothetical protein